MVYFCRASAIFFQGNANAVWRLTGSAFATITGMFYLLMKPFLCRPTVPPENLEGRHDILRCSENSGHRLDPYFPEVLMASSVSVALLWQEIAIMKQMKKQEGQIKTLKAWKLRLLFVMSACWEDNPSPDITWHHLTSPDHGVVCRKFSTRSIWTVPVRSICKNSRRGVQMSSGNLLVQCSPSPQYLTFFVSKIGSRREFMIAEISCTWALAYPGIPKHVHSAWAIW